MAPAVKRLRPDEPSEDTNFLDKPAPSYVALISKVLLTSSSLKLSLMSVYRAMEEQFPFLSRRRPGWRNSVRHSLSVNECFVKVSRCEDGRGHYWGVHPDYQGDFQRGNFRVFRRTRRTRRRRRRCDTAESFLRPYERRPLCWEEPRCPLQDPWRYQTPHLQTLNVSWVQSTTLRLPDSNSSAAAAGRPDSEPVTCRPLNDFTGMSESHDRRVVTPGCWCLRELMKPLEYRV